MSKPQQVQVELKAQFTVDLNGMRVKEFHQLLKQLVHTPYSEGKLKPVVIKKYKVTAKTLSAKDGRNAL